VEVRDSTTPEQRAKSVAAGHELTDVSIRGIAILGIGLMICAVVIYIGLWWMFRSLLDRELARDPELPPLATERGPPPRPYLEENPGVELKALQAAENRFLDSYGWVDEKNGVIHIPIDQAMKRLPLKLKERSKISDQRPAGATTQAEAAVKAPTGNRSSTAPREQGGRARDDADESQVPQ